MYPIGDLHSIRGLTFAGRPLCAYDIASETVSCPCRSLIIHNVQLNQGHRCQTLGRGQTPARSNVIPTSELQLKKKCIRAWMILLQGPGRQPIYEVAGFRPVQTVQLMYGAIKVTNVTNLDILWAGRVNLVLT